MKKDNYIALIFKKLKGDISLEEQSMLDVWGGQSAENEQLIQELEKDWTLTEQYEAPSDLDLDVAGDFRLLQQRIEREENLAVMPKDNLRVAHQPIGKVVTMSSKKSTNRWLGWASAAVVALALGFWFMNQSTGTTVDILALETKYKEKKEVKLADGTKVWLNGDSKISYPNTFAADTRSVKLTGEAFFEVAKNAAKPFIIETAKTKVTVLGTSFNVRARIAEMETEVVVKTGKVRLENIAGDKKVELTPNQKGIYNASSNTIKELAEKDMNELAWHSDRLLFANTPLEEVMTVLAKQFEVTINLKNEAMANCLWDGLYKTELGINKILAEVAEDFEMELNTLGNTSFELIGGNCTVNQ